MSDPIRELIAIIHDYTVLRPMDPPVVSRRCMIYDIKEPEELRQKIIASVEKIDRGIYLQLRGDKQCD